MNWQTVAILGIIVLAIAGCLLAVGPILSNSGALDAILLQAEADSANARANEMEMEAELVEEQAALEVAQGERALAEAQGEALTTAVKASNRLVTWWGFSFPLMPLVYGAIFGIVGLLAGCAIGYAVGLNRALAVATAPKEQTTVKTNAIPTATIQGAGV